MQLLSRKQLLLSYWAATTATRTTIVEPPSIQDTTTPRPKRPYDAWARTVRRATQLQLQQQPAVITPAALIRLAFHDAVTMAGSRGPNGSIRHELAWSENRALAQPLALVQAIYDDSIKDNNRNMIESIAVESFADTIALVACQAIEYSGGPHIPIRLGRIDRAVADPYLLTVPLMHHTPRSRVTKTMPDAGLDSDGLRLYFHQRFGLTNLSPCTVCTAWAGTFP